MSYPEIPFALRLQATINLENSFLFRELDLNQLSVFVFIYISNRFRELGLNRLSSSWVYYFCHKFSMTSLSFFSRIFYEFVTIFANFLLIVSRIDYKFTIYSANPAWINYLFCEFIVNSLSYSQIYYQYTGCFSNSLYIHYVFREFTMNSQSISKIYYEFTICFAS